MNDKTKEMQSVAGLWITLIVSIAFLIQQLASNGLLG
jgi:hypothetical protein